MQLIRNTVRIAHEIGLPRVVLLNLLGVLVLGCAPVSMHDSLKQLNKVPVMSKATTKWMFSDDSRGVAMVIHGLNLRPSAMSPVSEHLVAQGVDVLQVTLSGHDMALEDDQQRLHRFKHVSYRSWRREIQEAYALLAARAAEREVPKYLVGYSIGALLGIDILMGDSSDRESPMYDKMLLLAPAVAVRPTSHFLRPFSWFPEMVMPSFSPRDYHANWGTPMAAYNALYDAMAHFDERVSSAINIPSLVIIDNGDELVSPSGIEHLVDKYQLTQWNITFIEKSNDANTWYNHLLLDEWSLGKQSWRDMMQSIDEFLIQEK